MEKAYANRRDTIKRKTKELSILCNVKACAILLWPNGEVDTWPENHTDLSAILDSFKNRGTKNVKKSFKVYRKKAGINGGCLKKKKNFAVDDQLLDTLSMESKKRLLVKLNSKVEAVKKRIEFLRMDNNGVGVSTSREKQEEKEVVLVDQETQNSFWESVKVDGQQVSFVKTQVQISSSFGELMKIACNQGQEVSFGELMNTSCNQGQEFDFDELMNTACNRGQEFDFGEPMNIGYIQDQEAAFSELMNTAYNQGQKIGFGEQINSGYNQGQEVTFNEIISFGELMNTGRYQGQEFGFFGHVGQNLISGDCSSPPKSIEFFGD